MRRTTSILLAGSVLGAIGIAVFSSFSSGASFQGAGGNLPVDILSAPRLDVSATTPPGTWLGVAGDENGARLEVAVPTGVVVSGAVELGPTSAALLAGRTCVYGPVGHLEVDGGLTDIPGMTGRTGVQLVAHDFGPAVDFVSCWPGQVDGGNSPNCTVGSAGIGVPIHERGSATFDLSNAYIVRCLTCAHAGGAGATTATVSGANSQCAP